MTRSGIAAAIVLMACGATVARGNQVILDASKDNTLYEDPTGNLSGGAGYNLFVGRLAPKGGGLLRRAVFAFNLSGIPTYAKITSASLTIFLSRGNGGSTPVELHRVTQNWGEGASFGGPQASPAMSGDATWLHTFYTASTWTNAGGDFDSTVSGVQNADNFATSVTWNSTSDMVANVQAWVATPATNFGWLLKGDESNTQTAKEFNSRENSGGPSLTVDFTVPEPGALALLAFAPLLARRPRR